MKNLLFFLVVSMQMFCFSCHDTNVSTSPAENFDLPGGTGLKDTNDKLIFKEIDFTGLPKAVLKNGWSLVKAIKWGDSTQPNLFIVQEFRRGDLEEEGSGWHQKIKANLIRNGNFANPEWVFEDSLQDDFGFIQLGKDQIKVEDSDGDNTADIFLYYAVLSTQGEDPDLFNVIYLNGNKVYKFIRKIDQNNFNESIDTMTTTSVTSHLPVRKRSYFEINVDNYLRMYTEEMQNAQKK